MFVPQSIKDRVNAEITRCITVLEAKYPGQRFAFPTIVYELRGVVAGTAEYRKWKIDINPGYLLDPRYTDQMILQTVPHEFAHLATDQMYPEAHQPRFAYNGARGGVVRKKREPHGDRWQSVMRDLGKEPRRLHSMDATNVRIVKSNSRQVEWKCAACGALVLLTPKKSEAVRKTPSKWWHTKCKGSRLIEVKGTAQPAATAPTAITLRPPAPQPTPVIPTWRGESKLDTCRALFSANPAATRGELIALFIKHALCTPAGAATYYASIKNANK